MPKRSGSNRLVKRKKGKPGRGPQSAPRSSAPLATKSDSPDSPAPRSERRKPTKETKDKSREVSATAPAAQVDDSLVGKLKSKWLEMPERDRYIAIIGAVALIGLAVYFFVSRPQAPAATPTPATSSSASSVPSSPLKLDLRGARPLAPGGASVPVIAVSAPASSPASSAPSSAPSAKPKPKPAPAPPKPVSDDPY